MTLFHASADQHELVGSFTRPLEELFPLARLHQDASDYAHWREAAEFGWFGVSLGEDAGGIGLTAVEDALLYTQFGRHLVSPGFMAATLAARVAAQAGDDALAGEILAGEAPVAMALRAADGGVTLFDADEAKFGLVCSAKGAEIFAIGARRVLDRAQWGIGLATTDAAGPVVALADPAIAVYASLLVAAQLTGIAAAALDMAVAYSLLRQQFGAPIGSFQAIKHYCADMAMQALAAKDRLSFSAVALAEGRPEHGFQVAAALNVAIRAALFNARTNIQIHGGMGFSAECDAHLFLKRAHVLETLAGGLKANRAALRAESAIVDEHVAVPA